jgi:hypothetical protein
MSNHLAIATVTVTLQKILQASVQVDVDGARVTTIRPSNLGTGTPESGVNIYLYNVAINPVWRNSADVVNRNRKGDIGKKSRTALDLHYLLSFYGNEVELEPQRLLGSVVRTFTDRKTLTKDMIRDAIAYSNFTYLLDSDLAEQAEDIFLIPLELPLEDLTKIWSVFLQTPYALSMAYKATVVVIEGEQAAQKALPVRDFRIGALPIFNQPTIDWVVSREGKSQPILADSILLIQGRYLKHENVRVRIGRYEVIPLEVSDTQITLPLSSLPTNSLRFGVQSLQVVHQIPSAIRNSAVESNVAPFVLRPTIREASIANLEGEGDEGRSGELTVMVNLDIGKAQRVVLALNELSNSNPVSYLFDVSPRQENTTAIKIPIQDIRSGEYLLRLHVDGAESNLLVDTNPDSPTFNYYSSPKVLIP